jgi:hypothetical protein
VVEERGAEGWWLEEVGEMLEGEDLLERPWVLWRIHDLPSIYVQFEFLHR